MKITEIYQKYRINKGLQEHMIRVAAVAKQICDNSPLPIDTKVAVSACLLHDMGNLIKVDFKINGGHFEPEGIDYWKAAKLEMIEKYGDVKTATDNIVKEINPLMAITDTVKEASLINMKNIESNGTLEAKVLEYADMRVNLWGIVSLAERFADIRDRYVPHKHSAQYIDELEIAAKKIEQELFARASIASADITDKSTADIQLALQNWDIPLDPQV